MSEPIPESIPTSADPRSNRPLKRARGADTAIATQAKTIDYLFSDPERTIKLPETSSKSSCLAPPPEIVANVQGSSAGAGSGEFHVYKASRRREYERLREMDAEAKAEEDQDKWEHEEAERKKGDEERTAKNREKRAKKKGKKGGKIEAAIDTNGHASNGVKKAPNIPKPIDKGDVKADPAFGVGKVVEEVGIVIHDDG